jgi:hypothetical protein
VPKSGLIRRLHFRTGTVTTGATVDCRLETVDASTGHPTGTLYAANTNGSNVIADTDDNAWRTSANFTADASVTRGDVVAAVIVNPSGGNWQLRTIIDVQGSVPYGDLFAAAAWTKNTNPPIIVAEYSDGTFAYVPNVIQTHGVNTTAFNSGSSPDERGVRFTQPFQARCVGLWALMFPAAGGNFDLVLYDTDGSTVLRSVSWDGDVVGNASGAEMVRLLFASDVTLAVSLTNPYRIALKPTTANNVTLLDFDVNAAGYLDLLPGGSAWHHTQRADAGAWSETTTKRSMVGLLLDQL